MVLNSLGLSNYEKSLGYTSHLGERKSPIYNLTLDYNLKFESGNILKKLFRAIFLFLKIRNKYDVFHFQYGTSILDFDYNITNHLDLPFYPKESKLIFTFNGDDARLSYNVVDGIDFNAELQDYLINKNHFNLNRRIQKIKKVSRYAHKIFAVNPDLLNFLPASAEFVPYSIPNVYNLEKIDKDFTLNPFIIVHAPTNRDVKGSKYILSALEELKSKFPFIEVILVENIPYKEALDIYRMAHLVIDQVVIGWYGGLSVEVMRMGIPVACYLRNEDFKYVPEAMIEDLSQSIINISPLNIVDPITDLINNREKLKYFGDNGYHYANTWHSPDRIAKQMVSKYLE